MEECPRSSSEKNERFYRYVTRAHICALDSQRVKRCCVWQPHSLHTHQESCVQGHGAGSAVVWGRDLDTEG